MAVKLSELRAGRPLPPGIFLELISVRGRDDPRATVGLEGLGQFKNPITSSRIEPTIQLGFLCVVGKSSVQLQMRRSERSDSFSSVTSE
jgi:hypothetical protein